MLHKRIICFFIIFLTISTFIFSQNINEDIINNNLERVKAKLTLVKIDKAFPYISKYLLECKIFNEEMLSLLIESGANVDLIDQKYNAPLYVAIVKNNARAVKMLIEAKANVNAIWKIKEDGKITNCYPYFDGKKIATEFGGYSSNNIITTTPLLVSFFAKNPNVTKYLLLAGAKASEVITFSENGKAIYTISIMDIIGANFQYLYQDNFFAIPEYLKIDPVKFYNGFQILSQLKKEKASSIKINANLYKNIYIYLCNNDIEKVKEILAKTTESTINYLPFAIMANNWPLVDLLLTYNGITINDNFIKDTTIVEYCIKYGLKKELEIAVNHGVKIVGNIDGNWDLLSYATYSGDLDMVIYLLQQKIDPNLGTPLQYANLYPDIRNKLIEYGAETQSFFISKFMSPDDIIPSGRNFYSETSNKSYS